MMLVVALAVLLVRLGSWFRTLPRRSLSVAVAELVMAEAPIATVTFTVALEPAGIPPRVQLNCDPRIEHAPCVVVDETKFAGRLSARVTFGASPGPRLETPMV